MPKARSKIAPRYVSHSPSANGSGGHPSDAPELVVERPPVLAYSRANLFVMLWRDAPTDESLDAVHVALEALAARRGGSVAIASIITRDARPPNAQHRERVRLAHDRLADRIRCLGLLVEGIGFWASALLGAATAIIVSRRPRFPQHVCRTREDLVKFVVSHAAGTPAADRAFVTQTLEAISADAVARAT